MEETLSRYQVMAEAARDIILVVDLNGKILKANEAACAAYGYTREELLKLTIFDLRTVDTSHLVYCQMDQASKEGTVFETKHRHKDGHVIPVEVSSKRAVIGNKSVLLSTIRDISGRVNQETEIRKLFTAVQQSPVSVVITDLNGNIEYVNPKFTQVTGYTLDEAIGQNPRVLKSGAQPPEVYKELWDTITSGREWRGEFHNKKKNGELYWEMASISPIRSDAGKITNFIAIKEDITERKAAEAALKQAHAELNQIIESSSDGICVTDLEANIVRTNSAFAGMCGIEKDKLIGVKSCEVLPSGFCETAQCSLSRVLQGEHRFEFDQDVTDPDGNKRHWLVSVNSYHDASGELAGMVKTYKEITERVRVEQSLHRDLLLAGKIQRGFLPKRICCEAVLIDTVYEPYHHVSGDVYDYIWDKQNNILTGYLADVMGHGLGTALQTSALRVLFRQALESNISPRDKLAWINREALPYFAEDSFAAAICFELNFNRKMLRYAVAGINYFLAETPEHSGVISMPGPFLGITTEFAYEDQQLVFSPGSAFYFMSDGLFDLLKHNKRPNGTSFDETCNYIRSITKSSLRRDDASALCIYIK